MFVESELRGEMASLGNLLGDTRVRYRKGQTPAASADELVDLDLEIRSALSQPLSDDLQVEVRSLLARLRALDPR
jgi:hypothetical protein